MLQAGVPAWHTPEDMEAFSNAAHVAEGVVIAAAALIALAQAAGHAHSGRTRLASPMLVLFGGVFLLVFLLFPHHGLDLARDQWVFIFGDPQQRQHLLIAAALAIAGWAEVAHQRRPRKWLAIALPIALALIGASFLLHTQHGTTAAVERATHVHRLLGSVLTATAALVVASRLKPKVQWLHYAWPIALLFAALLLFAYREPIGAYGGHDKDQGHRTTVRELTD
jgi:hypothetical protein